MMNKLFRKKLTRGGFTLAELLIVVAIIAILVAVAVPIFIHNLEEARLSVHKANIRAVRVSAINYILSGLDDPAGSGYKVPDPDGNGWHAMAKVSKTGEITELKIEVNSGSGKTSTDAINVTDDNNLTWTGNNWIDKDETLKATAVPQDGYWVRVQIQETMVKSGS